MKVATIPNAWIREEGHRLDPRPYTNGAVGLRKAILRLPHSRLQDVTAGFRGGIFTHLFSPKRTYAPDPAYGIPFLGASSMLQADLSDLPQLSNRDAESRSYKPLRIRQGMTLVSCSGSVGRMVYARRDMDGMASAGDLLKIQPDPALIAPGYLFAFLSSNVGSRLVGSGTYGTIVQHLERQHVVDIPIPRLGEPMELDIHRLVEAASEARVAATRLLEEAQQEVRSLLRTASSERDVTSSSCKWNSVQASHLQARLDAFYYNPDCVAARESFDRSELPNVPLGEVSQVFIPGIFKRRYAEAPEFGFPYVTGGDVFQIRVSTDRYLIREVALQYELLVEKHMILVQEAGQLGGLIGRCVFVGDHLDGHAVSNNMVRLRTPKPTDAGYIYAILSTREGVLLVSREAAGSSIPHLDSSRVSALKLPWPPPQTRNRIGEKILEATKLRDSACLKEAEARAIVERAIEEAD